ncbi:MAG: hypothetical protein M3Y80_10870 [Verrucomicrobiota bacterium]|nr:hypothetical protein [Verrucomicrobiota bacterium]
MKTLSSRSCRACVVASLVFGTAPALLAADIVLQKVPALTVEEAPGYPENLARQQFGATVETLDAKAADASAATALLSGDPTASYAVPTGTTTLLVALSKIENVGSISLVNQGAKGTVSIATSNAKLPADSPQWHSAYAGQLSADPIRADIGAGEAKYVRLTFNVTEPGRIAGLGVYSTGRISEFTAPRTTGGDNDKATFGLVSYSQTDMHAKARALYVSSGADLKEANKMIDDQTVTTYSFAAGDAAPTAVIDLGAARSLHRLSAVYGARAGKMAFYVTSSLPGNSPENAAQTVTLTDDSFAGMKAVGSSTDDGSLGRATVDFPETTGRYVIVKWTPEAQQDTGFSVAEIAAIGAQNRTVLAANEGNRDRRYVTDGKTVLDGKTMIDAKDRPPGEGPQDQSPAEGPPPSLPQPPPFTFVPVSVPVLVPTSP